MNDILREASPAQRSVTLDSTHDHLHRGFLFAYGNYTTALAASGTVLLLLQAPDDRQCHLRLAFAAGGNCSVELFEDPTVSANGTALTPYNRNRLSANQPATKMWLTPTTSALGTLLDQQLVVGGTGGQAPGGDISWDSELLIGDGRLYLVRLTNVTSQAIELSSSIYFYEVQHQSV